MNVAIPHYPTTNFKAHLTLNELLFLFCFGYICWIVSAEYRCFYGLWNQARFFFRRHVMGGGKVLYFTCNSISMYHYSHLECFIVLQITEIRIERLASSAVTKRSLANTMTRRRFKWKLPSFEIRKDLNIQFSIDEFDGCTISHLVVYPGIWIFGFSYARLSEMSFVWEKQQAISWALLQMF